SGDFSIAIGTGGGTGAGAGTVAAGQHSIAIGFTSTANDESAIALGNAASVLMGATSGLAIGSGAIASIANSVALGAGSTTVAATPNPSITLGGTVHPFAGAAPVGVVSVGSTGNERQIQNVAAGVLSGTSTDAVNGSQLFATNEALQSAIAGS